MQTSKILYTVFHSHAKIFQENLLNVCFQKEKLYRLIKTFLMSLFHRSITLFGLIFFFFLALSSLDNKATTIKIIGV